MNKPTEHCEFTERPGGGFFCKCGAGSKGLPGPPTGFVCPLVHPPGRPDLRPPPAVSLDEATACIHRGFQVRTAACGHCGGRGDLFEIYRCNNPQVPEVDCTTSVRGRDAKDVAVCLGCDHQQHPEDEGAEMQTKISVDESTWPSRRKTPTPPAGKLKISIDFDGTAWGFQGFFRAFMWAMKADGHVVGMLTGHHAHSEQADRELLVARGFPDPDFWIGRHDGSEEHGGTFKPRMIERHGIDIHFDDMDFNNSTTKQYMGRHRKVFRVHPVDREHRE